MLSKNDFWPRLKKSVSKNKPVSRILIQASSISDYIIAHFHEFERSLANFFDSTGLHPLYVKNGQLVVRFAC